MSSGPRSLPYVVVTPVHLDAVGISSAHLGVKIDTPTLTAMYEPSSAHVRRKRSWIRLSFNDQEEIGDV